MLPSSCTNHNIIIDDNNNNDDDWTGSGSGSRSNITKADKRSFLRVENFVSHRGGHQDVL